MTDPTRGQAFFVRVTRTDRRITHRLFRTARKQPVPGFKRYESKTTNHVVVSSAVESKLMCTGERIAARDVVFAAAPDGNVLSYDDLAELEHGSVRKVLEKAGFEVVGAV